MTRLVPFASSRFVAARRGVVFGGLSAAVLALAKQDATTAPQTPAEALAMADRLAAAVQVERCNARNAIGVGLLGEYFSQRGLQGELMASRVDASVDFDADLNWPAGAPQAQARSVRWRGWVKPPLQGVYRFHAEVSGASIEVSGLKLVGNGAAADAHIDMVAGRFYPITLEMPTLPANGSRIRLEWTAPHGARYVVPRQLLYLPTESVSRT